MPSVICLTPNRGELRDVEASADIERNLCFPGSVVNAALRQGKASAFRGLSYEGIELLTYVGLTIARHDGDQIGLPVNRPWTTPILYAR